MKENCLEIGVIQSFMDGELGFDETALVTGHFAVCDACALALAEAEDESAIVFPALEREFNTLVPTQRLWNKINDSIAVERDNMPFWQKAWAFLTVAVANRSLAIAASILIVVGVVATVLINRMPEPYVIEKVAPAGSISTPVVIAPSAPKTGDVLTGPVSTFEPTSYRSNKRRIAASPAVYKTSASVNANSDGYMPGEESYVKTISSLTKTVAEQKDGVMRPSERIAYERDMAVVNDSIDKMKQEVKRNPKNESAKQVLYSSYQNKIDLLNSVAQKEELVASLR